MQLARILLAFELESDTRISAFLASDDVKKQKFGIPEPLVAPNAPFVQFIQPDGFRIAIVGRQVQVTYE
ncbi:MAG TPA: hypothetical protein VGH02_12910, partial [Rhizomicrobium sp.]